jgi:ketosteroid isomerase-like protein
MKSAKGLPKPTGTVARSRKAAQQKAVVRKKVRARTAAAASHPGAEEDLRAAAQKRATSKRAVRKRTTQAHRVHAAVEETRLAAERKATARALTRSRTTAAASEASAADRALQDLAKRIVDLTVRNDDDGCLALYAANVESSEAGQSPTHGIEAIREKYKGWREMTTTSDFRPRTVLAACNTIVIEWEGRVTLAASGKIAELNEVAIHEIENGKIVRERYYYNPAALQA